jgi:hypothetical protein
MIIAAAVVPNSVTIVGSSGKIVGVNNGTNISLCVHTKSLIEKRVIRLLPLLRQTSMNLGWENRLHQILTKLIFEFRRHKKSRLRLLRHRLLRRVFVIL